MLNSYFEKYHKEIQWYNKIILLEVYHICMRDKIPGWTISKTAEYFNVSTGLISENLSLAETIHKYPELINCESRVQALKKMSELVKD